MEAILHSRYPASEGEVMRPIPAGARGTYSMRVESRHLASRYKDAALPDVLATPVMVLAIENAALNAIRPYLEPGESAVGTVVHVEHLAGTPVGHQIEAEAEVTKVEGRRIEFVVSARDEHEQIGRGAHTRMVIDMPRLERRLAAKRKSGGA
jgi:fluoroacetyl-CoA thioesterase